MEQPQLVLESAGRAAWTPVPVPTLDGAPGAALVRPLAVATCDLDTVINCGTSVLPMPLPYLLGHEFVAEVLEVGADVAVARPGDRVVVPFQINCGRCRPCLRGLTGGCASVPHLSAYGLGAMGGDWGGAISDVVRVPFADAMLVPLPAGVDPAAAASMDNLTDGWRTVGPYLDLLDGDRRMLVIGGMSVGLYATAIGRALEVEVTYLDVDARRLAVAEGLGATVGDVDDRTATYPLTVHTSGRERGLRHAIKATEAGGTLVDTGIYAADVALPLLRMYTLGLTFVTGRTQARRDTPAVLDLVARGRLDPTVVTATTAPWADAAQAWSEHREKLVILR